MNPDQSPQIISTYNELFAIKQLKIERLKEANSIQAEQLKECRETIDMLMDKANKDNITINNMKARVRIKNKFIHKCLKKQNDLEWQIKYSWIDTLEIAFKWSRELHEADKKRKSLWDRVISFFNSAGDRGEF